MADGRLGRSVAFAYGAVAYVLGLATVVYAIGFLANAVVPKSVDAGVAPPLGDPLLANLALLGVFGLQHSVMARPWFKERWTRLVPEPVERSTYVLFASLALVLLVWGWQPMTATVWQVEGVPALALRAVYLVGWLLVVAAAFMIDGNHLFGFRQVTWHLRGRDQTPLDFQTPYLYRYVRHPIMTGFLVAFWVTPRMTVGHLVFAGVATGYILVGVKLEERDLVDAFGDRYRRYRAAVPMFVPRPWRTFSPSLDDGTTTDDR